MGKVEIMISPLRFGSKCECMLCLLPRVSSSSDVDTKLHYLRQTQTEFKVYMKENMSVL